MKLTIYKWFIGTMNDFTRQFGENETLINQARAFWRHLENGTLVYLIDAIVLGITCCILYYKIWNNMPGRHYHPKHWLYFLFATAIIAFAITLGLEYMFAKPRITGAWTLEIKLALCNAIYSVVMNFITSVAVCNLPIKTNAYKLFKI